MSEASVPTSHPYDLPYAAVDLARLREAHRQIKAFESFLLERFITFVASGQVHGGGGTYRRDRVVELGDGATVKNGVLREPGGWTHWHVDPSWRDHPEQDHVVIYRYMDDDRGPGSRDFTVQMPWAWVFGDIERAEDRAIFERLAPRFDNRDRAMGKTTMTHLDPAPLSGSGGDGNPNLWA